MDVENFSRKLWNRYSDNPSCEPTPCQTQRIISQNKFINKLSELTGIEDKLKLGNVFSQEKGKHLTEEEKMNFINCLNEFKKNNPDEYINFKSMNEKLIKQIIGDINTSRISKLLKKAKRK